MTFDEVLAEVRELLQREGRVSYRALKRRFALDDDYVEDLKAEFKVLSGVYNWFTEGFDTKDLQEAKTFIEGLGH